jgi:hypothetical protein
MDIADIGPANASVVASGLFATNSEFVAASRWQTWFQE